MLGQDAGGGVSISQKPVVFIMSDSIGETAELVARAAASQFNAGGIDFRRIPHVQDQDAVRQAVNEAQSVRSVIVFTLVLPELREFLREEARRQGVIAVDIMGPMMSALSTLTYSEPKLKPGLVHRMDDEYFRRIDAVEFAVKHDDGKSPRGMALADIVLIVVSRTSKTPLSLYLAQRCYRVANLPLVPEMPLPEELWQLPRGRVVGLTIQPEYLVRIRQERLKTMGLDPVAAYADYDRILRELEFARSVFDRLRCPVADVTDRAIEETASHIIQMTMARRDG
jgi:regulator of PEP synthase PpsR (kinase-PPPase family)